MLFRTASVPLAHDSAHSYARMSELEACGPEDKTAEEALTNAGAIDRPAAIHADARSLRHADPRRSGADSRRDSNTGCSDAGSGGNTDTRRSSPDARRDAHSGGAGINRAHDTSAGYAGGPAIDLGLGRCGDDRQEKDGESNSVQHHDLRHYL
jgi:hypothetical protein